MHSPEGFLYTLAVVCSVAAVTTVLCQRIRLPVVFGYLLAGMIVGPYVPVPLVADKETVSSLAEVGVVLLMFSIGLEFSLRRMLRMAPVSGLVTLVESTAMFGLGVTVAELMGGTLQEAVFTGAIVTVSSSTIIARAFREHPVERPVRDTVYSIMVFEDLIGILESLAGEPAFEAITMGHPERMGQAYGWSEAHFLAASRTTTPKGEAYQNLCIGCDRFHEQLLGPVLEAAHARRRAARGEAPAPRAPRTIALVPSGD